MIKASLPGVARDDVQITVLGDTLTTQSDGKGEKEKDEER